MWYLGERCRDDVVTRMYVHTYVRMYSVKVGGTVYGVGLACVMAG